MLEEVPEGRAGVGTGSGLTLVVKGVRELVTHHDPDAPEIQSPKMTERSSHKHLEGTITGESLRMGSEVTQQTDQQTGGKDGWRHTDCI